MIRFWDVLLFAFIFVSCMILARELDETKERVTKLEQELGKIQSVHICEDRSHETCKYDCDCNGLQCDTL